MYKGKFKDLMIQQAEKNFPSEISTESKDESQKPAEPTDEPQKASERDIALGIPGLFDTPLDDRTYYSAAEICLARNQRKPAETFCRKALETCNSPTLKYECLFLLARILRRRKRSDEAYENITQVLPYVDLEETPAKKKQAIWVEKARIEAKIGHKADALSSYGKAKAANPSQLTTGDALDEELHLFLDDRQKYLSVFKSWTPLERLTWMGWRYADWESNRHRDLRDVSAEAGETDFVIKAYEESIQYLDNVNAGAPLRNELALMYLESCDDLESARHVLDEVLDSHSSGWPYAVTDESPDITLEKTVLLQSNVLFRLFCRARDPTVKQELFDAAKGVMARPLAMDLPSRSDSELVPYHMTLLHMSRKMGPAKEFFALAQSIVDICVGNLLDNVGHNDSLNLVRLAKTLYILSDSMKNRDQLRHLANIFCSAKFSRLTTEAMADDNWEVPETVGDESDDEADEAEANGEDGVSHENMTKPPADEGDILSALTWGCDGECNPSMTWEWFGDQPMYDCLMCDYILCQPCYDARQADNAGVKPIEGRKFCGKDHKYIKTPMPGWKGIRNGKITIDGEDPEDFGELLVRFRDEILKETWSAFWEGA
jgi:tetratricopeptide (TPR) repeat protein